MNHNYFYKNSIPVTKGIADVVDATLVVEKAPELTSVLEDDDVVDAAKVVEKASELASVLEDGAGVDVIARLQFVSSIHFIYKANFDDFILPPI